MVRRISPIGENLHRLMNREDIKQAELSRISGVAQSTISRIILGEQRNPSVKIIRALAVALNAKVSDLVPDEQKEREREPRPIRDRSEREILQELDAKIKAKEDIVLVPVSSYSVSAGAGSAAEAEYIAYRRRPAERNHEFVAVEVKGHCLEPEVFEGELVIADKNAAPKEGDIVVAEYENDRIVKILSKENETYLLHALDGRPDILVNQATTILGVVVSITRRPRRRRV